MDLGKVVRQQHDCGVDSAKKRVGRPRHDPHKSARARSDARRSISSRNEILPVVEHNGDPLPLFGRVEEVALEQGIDRGDRLVVNYQRSAIAQQGSGHISPIAAYDSRSDRVLILDVARYRYPAVWVESEALWRAMGTVDKASGQSRGLLSLGWNPN
jgi:hypothetical protein